MDALRSALIATLFSGSPLGAAMADDDDPRAAARLVGQEGVDRIARSVESDARLLALGLDARLGTLRASAAGEIPDEYSVLLATEGIDLWGPLAERLGMPARREAIEDASFRLLDPESWAAVSTLTQSAAPRGVAPLVREVREILEGDGMRAEVHGRVKSAFSLHRKAVRKGLSYEDILDRVGVRVLVETQADCTAALDRIRLRMEPIEGTFDDYVRDPKPSGYRALHVTLIDSRGEPFELQVRTHEMHAAAEHGEAAHWAYRLRKA